MSLKVISYTPGSTSVIRFASDAGSQSTPLSQLPLPAPLPTTRMDSTLISVTISTPSPDTVGTSVCGSKVTVTSQTEVTLNVILS